MKKKHRHMTIRNTF